MNTPPILSLRVSNPFFEGHNQVYVIQEDPITLIDTGVATEIAYGKLIDQLAKHDLRIRDIRRVILTHKHIDHIGNAWRIQQEAGADILIHESEVAAVTDTDSGGGRFRELVSEKLAQWEVPDVGRPHPQGGTASNWEIESATAIPVRAQERIPIGNSALEVIHTPGHTYGSICLKYGRHLFSGDHVLPTISPNVGAGDMRRQGLLTHFIDSLQRMIDLSPEIEMTYPGHGSPFDYLQQRCQKLIDHHHQRLDKIIAILQREGALPIYKIATKLFGSLRDHHVVLGCAEAQSHLEYLITTGQVTHEQPLYSLA